MLILWLILFTQHDFVVCGVVVFPPMARSQRRTQIRCAASDMSIRRRREAPREVGFGRCWVVVDREPHPRMVPIVMCGQCGDSVGQLSVASCQIAGRSGLQHSSRMCSRVSVLSWQREHRARCS